MIKFEIESQDLRELKGISAKTSKPYHIRIQEAYAFIVDSNGKPAKYPEKFELMLEAEQAAWPIGFYTLHPSALSVRDGRLHIEPRFAPVKAA